MSYKNTLTERELLQDLMISERYLDTLYYDVLIDKVDVNLQKVITQCHQNNHDIQNTIFDALRKRGWNRSQPVIPRNVRELVSRFQ